MATILSSVQITFCNPNLSYSFIDMVFPLYKTGREDGDWYVYQCLWGEILLMILCSLFPNLWRAIKKFTKSIENTHIKGIRKVRKKCKKMCSPYTILKHTILIIKF